MLYNTELANDLGNLLNRSINMTKGFCNSTISVTNTDNVEDIALRECLAQSVSTYREAMDKCEVSIALQAINDHVTHCNGYLERHKPWEMKKDESKLSRVGEILSHTAESCAQLAVLLRPILPDAAAKIFGQLKKDDLMKLTLSELKWGLLEAGHQTGKPNLSSLEFKSKKKSHEKPAHVIAWAGLKYFRRISGDLNPRFSATYRFQPSHPFLAPCSQNWPYFRDQ